MSQDILTCILQIRSPSRREPVGTGFLVARRLAVTCSHVVEAAGSGPGLQVEVRFALAEEAYSASVLAEGWSPPDAGDLAVLRLDRDPPPEVRPAALGSSRYAAGLRFRSFGYARIGEVAESWAEGSIYGLVLRDTLLQLDSADISPGMSGAPVVADQRVVGIVTSAFVPDETLKHRDVAYAIPAEAIAAALARIDAEIPGVPQTPRASVPFLAPPLPMHFVSRDAAGHAFKECLLARGRETPGILTLSAIHGLGGIGKSTLMAALARDLEVLDRFPDGVLWATLGQEPNVLELLRSWIQELGDYGFRAMMEATAAAHLRTLLQGRAMLLVIDDVWSASHVQWFRAGGPRCRLVLTTRRADVAEELGAEVHELGVMTQEEALQLLAARLGRGISDLERADALRLAKEVGYLPLALEVAAARVARGADWVSLWQALAQEVARLEDLEPPRRRQHPRANRLEACFHLSLQALRIEDPVAWEAFVGLALLPEDAVVTSSMAATLWSCDERQAAEILETLWSDALLLQATPAGFQRTPTYRLHDLLGDIARRLLVANPPEGLGRDLASAHVALLERYRSLTQAGAWHTLPDDGYIHTHLTWHMERARRWDLVHALLRETAASGGNGWFEACEKLALTTVFISDVLKAWKNAEEDFAAGSSPASLGLQCRYTLMAASLNSLTRNISPELLGQLVEKEVWSPLQALMYAQRIPVAEQQCKALARLAQPLVRAGLSRQLLEAVAEIRALRLRAETLSGIAPYEPEAARELRLLLSRSRPDPGLLALLVPHADEAAAREVLDSLGRIVNAYEREKLVAALVTNLPQPLLGFAASALGQIGIDSIRARALASLAPRLPAAVLPDAVARAFDIRRLSDRFRALAALGAHLPEPLLAEMLERFWEARNEHYTARLIEVVAPRLGPELVRRALDLSQAFRSGTESGRVLIALAPWSGPIASAIETASRELPALARTQVLVRLPGELPEDLLAEAIVRALQIRSDPVCAEVIERLVLRAPRPAARRLVDRAWTLREEGPQVRALVACLPHLEDSRISEMLRLSERLSDEGRARLLAGLASRLPERFADEMVSCFRGIEKGWCRMQALFGLVRHSVEPRIAELLDLVEQLPSARERLRILTTLAELLPEGQLPAALRIAERIHEAECRSSALLALGPHLPPSLRGTCFEWALAAARNIERGDVQSRMLGFLAEQAPRERLPAILAIAQAIRDEDDQVATIVEILSPSADREVRRFLVSGPASALAEAFWTQLLMHLAPGLPPALLDLCLEKVIALEDRRLRAHALARLVPLLPESSLWPALVALAGGGADEPLESSLFSLAPLLGAPAQARHDSPAAPMMWYAGSVAGSNLSVAVDWVDPWQEPILEELGPPEAAPETAGAASTGTAVESAVSGSEGGEEEDFNLVSKWAGFAQLVQDGNIQRAERSLLVADPADHKDESPARLETLRAALLAVAFRRQNDPAQTLVALTPYLSTASLRDALTVAARMPESRARAWALTALAPHLPERWLFDAVLAALGIVEDDVRMECLVGLAPALPHPLRESILEAVLNSPAACRITGLPKLVSHLPEAMLGRVFQAIVAVEEDWGRAVGLVGLARRLPLDQLERVIQQAAALQDPQARALALIGLGESEPRRMERYSLFREALRSAAARTRRDALRSLVALAPFLWDEGGAEAFQELFGAIVDVGRWWA